ncbi:LamG-like jellyroll fold domain-containing protein [Haloarcula laminariae]|uniref:LamG-like jellyroll fold domain-containing protein n=1 Tax=Haloarcula laminariae TaxID=2961577 RepID=UPI0021C8FD63|nr:LamG-like jellyroll fold domain-containing protein [Halomicroarcula laminariae]
MDTASTQTAVVGEENLVSRWPFSDGFADVAGGNDATAARDSPSIERHSGRDCVAFDGTDALRASRGGHGELDLCGADQPRFCITMWAYFDSETGNDPSGESAASHSLYRNDTGVRIVGREAESGSGVGVRLSISPYSDGDANGYSMADEDEVTVPVDEWHHLAFLVTPGERLEIYVDGEVAFTDDQMDGYNESSSDFWTDVTIGSWYGGNPEEWGHLMRGKLADLRVYQPGIDEPQIQQVYRETAPKADSGIVRADDLVARWPFANGFDDTVGDADASIGQGDPTVGRYHGRAGVAMDGDDGLLVGSGSDNPELSIVEREHGPVTVTGWLYFDSTEGGSPNNSPADHHILRNDAEYVLEALPAADTSGSVEIRFGISSLGEGESYTTDDATDAELHVTTGEWHHLALVVNAADYLTCYIDGAEAFHDDDLSGYSPRNTNYWSHQTIGSWYGTSSPDWYDLLVGKLSDLRIYDGQLSGDEVREIYTNSAQASATFAVDIVSTNAPVTAGTEVSVTAEVENTGDADGTQLVTLERSSGTELDETEVTLGAGATDTVTLTWNLESSETGDRTISVVTDDHVATRSITLQSSETPTSTPATATDSSDRLRDANRLATVTLEGEDHYVLDQIPEEPDDRYAFTTTSYELLEPERAASVAISYRYCEEYPYDSQARLESVRKEYEKWEDAEQLARTANLFTKLSGVLALGAVDTKASAVQVLDLAVTTFDWGQQDFNRPYHEVFANIGGASASLEWAENQVPEATESLENISSPAVDIAQSTLQAYERVDDVKTIAESAATVVEVFRQADSIHTSVGMNSISSSTDLKSTGFTVLATAAISIAVEGVSNAAEAQSEIAAIGKAAAGAQQPLLNKLIGLETLVNNYSIGPSGILRMLALRQVDYQIEASASYGISKTYEDLSSGALGDGYDAALGAETNAQEWEDNGSTWLNLSQYTAAAVGASFGRGLDNYQDSLNYEEYGPQSTFDY